MKNRRQILQRGAMAAAVLGLSLGTAQAQLDTYPSKPIRLIIPYPAGGGTDMIGRTVGAELAKAWGVPVLVENKAGASGMLGNDLAAKAPADGYTVVLAITALVQMPGLYAKLPYQVSDLAPVSLVARSMDIFMVPKSTGITTLAQFAAKAKAAPGQLSFASYGNATSSHMHGEQLKAKGGLDLIHVPFAGSGPEMTAVLGGQVDSAFVDATAANPHLKSDKLNFLAVTGSRRHPALPDVPTMGELGYAGFEANGWFSFFVPAATPRPIVDKMSAEIQKIVKSPAIFKRFSDMGLLPAGSTPEELAEAIRKDQPHWAAIARDAKIKVE
jgi:tripartite-type tricarboxylate transporter receptor subunit TctC